MKQRKFKRHYVFHFVALLILNLGAEHVLADNLEYSPVIHERWKFELGGFQQHAILGVSAGPDGEVPDVIDLNRLGADKSDLAIWLAGRWRINSRWHIGFSFVEVKRNGFAQAVDDFVFGEPPDEVNVTLGATVESVFNTRYYILQGGYSLIRTEQANFGIGAGLHIIDMEASISARITGNGDTTDLDTGKSNSTVPLPNLYIFGDYAFSPEFAATGSVGWFGIEIDKYGSSLVSVNANLEYRLRKNFGIGLGYTHVNVGVTIDEPDSQAKFEIDASGPRIYLIASFGSAR